MKVGDIRYGRSVRCELLPAECSDFGRAVPEGMEVSLALPSDAGEPLLRVGDAAWAVKGATRRDARVLAELASRAFPRIVRVVGVRAGAAGADAVVVESREFALSIDLDATADLAVDETIVESVRRSRKAQLTVPDVVNWLDEELVVRADGELARVLVSAAPDEPMAALKAFRVWGKRLAADVVRGEDDRFFVTRVIDVSRRINDGDSTSQLALVRGEVRFVDHTVAGRFRGAARTQLDDIVRGAGSYLALWKQYSELETQLVRSSARRVGTLPYRSAELRHDGCWRFRLADGGDADERLAEIEDADYPDIEAAVRPPTWLTSNEEPEKGEGDGRKPAFVGECILADPAQREIVLREVKRDEAVEPPDHGFLFVSLRGHEVQLRRKKEAYDRVRSAECCMPQLGLLIEGRPVPSVKRRGPKVRQSVVAPFLGGPPTPAQLKALQVAIHTPDLALIQGPPGTGKTRVVAALQALLGDEDRSDEGIGARTLLSGYQHDAVENAAAATRVFGLPPVKIGHRRGDDTTADMTDRWRSDLAEKVRARVATLSDGGASSALREVRRLVPAYLASPGGPRQAVERIDEALAVARDHVPSELVDRAVALRQSIDASALPGSGVACAEREFVLTAVRGLRVEPTAFLDDGPAACRRALSRMTVFGAIGPADEELLRRGVAWNEEGAPSFLPELASLRDRWIDSLKSVESAAGPPGPNLDVAELLSAIASALRERVRDSETARADVLQEYVEDLESDAEAVRDAVREYTQVLAATCQQAVGRQMQARKQDQIVFDTVIIDEAARAAPLDLLIPMSRAERRVVLVGDHRQLPHLLEPDVERQLEQSVTEETRAALRRSLFERLFTELKERERRDGIPRTVTLDVQYRMHPVLGDFVSSTFYEPHGEAFRSGRAAAEFAHGLDAYGSAVAAWIDVPHAAGSERGGRSKRRPAEAARVAKAAHEILAARPDLSVGIITFYSAQVDELMSALARPELAVAERTDEGTLRIGRAWRTTLDGKRERLRVGTVDAFQGKEFDVVLLSVTRSNRLPSSDAAQQRAKFGHLMLENRLCVSMSRQQRLLIVVGDASMYASAEGREATPGLAKFLDLCGGRHGVCIHA